jgi:hypothetical protein
MGQSVAAQFLQVARGTNDPAQILVGYRLVGSALQNGGQQRESRHYIEHVVAAFVAHRDQRSTAWFNYDQLVLARAMLARVLWVQNYVGKAVEQANVSFNEAQAIGRVSSLLFALVFAVYPISVMTSDFRAAEWAITTVLDLS